MKLRFSSREPEQRLDVHYLKSTLQLALGCFPSIRENETTFLEQGDGCAIYTVEGVSDSVKDEFIKLLKDTVETWGDITCRDLT